MVAGMLSDSPLWGIFRCSPLHQGHYSALAGMMSLSYRLGSVAVFSGLLIRHGIMVVEGSRYCDLLYEWYHPPFPACAKLWFCEDLDLEHHNWVCSSRMLSICRWLDAFKEWSYSEAAYLAWVVGKYACLSPSGIQFYFFIFLFLNWIIVLRGGNTPFCTPLTMM